MYHLPPLKLLPGHFGFALISHPRKPTGDHRLELMSAAAVPAEGRMQTHEGGRSPQPLLLLSIFSMFLSVICIGQSPEQTTWQSVIERSILIRTQ